MTKQEKYEKFKEMAIEIGIPESHIPSFESYKRELGKHSDAKDTHMKDMDTHMKDMAKGLDYLHPIVQKKLIAMEIVLARIDAPEFTTVSNLLISLTVTIGQLTKEIEDINKRHEALVLMFVEKEDG